MRREECIAKGLNFCNNLEQKTRPDFDKILRMTENLNLWQLR